MSEGNSSLMDAGSMCKFLRERMEDQSLASLNAACRALADHLRVEAAKARAPSDVLERIASERLSDPATDDLTVPLAIQLAETEQKLARAVSQVEKLSAKLEPFAKAADNYADCTDEDRCIDDDATVSIAMLREARAAHSSTEQSHG